MFGFDDPPVSTVEVQITIQHGGTTLKENHVWILSKGEGEFEVFLIFRFLFNTRLLVDQ